MFTHLTISHYALIENLDIDIRSGFSVITGETGAGKSIMLGALNLLLGNRADAKAIQTGQKKCMVEATFNISNLHLQPFFAAHDIDYDARECIIRREVMNTGKSRAFINDTPVSATVLKEIGASLIDIHSQHQNLLIRNEHYLIDLLDTVAANPTSVKDYKERYEACRKAMQALEQLRTKAAQGRTDLEFLQFQLAQLDEAELKADEQEELESEQQLLSHAEDIKQALFQARNALKDEQTEVSHSLRTAEDKLNGIAHHLPLATSLSERLHSLRIEVDDICDDIERQCDEIDYDPARLTFIEERLNTIYRLEQKHHTDNIKALIDLAEQMRTDINAIENVDADIALAEKGVEKLKALRDEAAGRLTEQRKQAAETLQKELIAMLQPLGMPHVRIEFQLSQRTEPDTTGADKVICMFSANKNVPLQDVSLIASGGEIARLMLALKAIIAQRTLLPTIVFDEIDTGVSGNMAERMAEVMSIIARSCQVLCITHLPQIAAWGTHHFRVYKEDSADTTRSHIIPLTQEERVEEVAHMLSGTKLTEAAIENARSLLEHNSN